MMSLKVIRLKLNPWGKDKTTAGYATPSQLAGEWIDVQNVGSRQESLAGVQLYHKVYGRQYVEGWNFESIRLFGVEYLPAGQIMRIHSGKLRDLSVVSAYDQDGAHWHTFTGQDRYIWNNVEGDSAALTHVATNDIIDFTSYDRWPPEGAVLIRSGDKLVVPVLKYW